MTYSSNDNIELVYFYISEESKTGSSHQLLIGKFSHDRKLCEMFNRHSNHDLRTAKKKICERIEILTGRKVKEV